MTYIFLLCVTIVFPDVAHQIYPRRPGLPVRCDRAWNIGRYGSMNTGQETMVEWRCFYTFQGFEDFRVDW